MGKPQAQRQKYYIKKLKEKNPEDYKRKEVERKRNARAKIKLSSDSYEAYKAKDRQRKKKASNLPEVSTPNADDNFRSRQSLGKAVSKVFKSLPRNQGKIRFQLFQY